MHTVYDMCPITWNSTGVVLDREQVWTVWAVDATAKDFVLLGDLTKYAALSGTRFRLVDTHATQEAAPAASRIANDNQVHLVVVGAPAEVVPVTYLTRTQNDTWSVHVRECTVGDTGRVVVVLP
eukprot:m.1076757 g.1076757  ORF g.1076757 m.1076757 type:complete len:124 (-) comp24248_c0_seq5:447-818(-)